TTAAVQTLSVSISLVGAGGIATISLFDIPELQAQPASRSLPSTRWLFSRGSHIFPQAAFLSSFGFTYLAYMALSPASRALSQLFRFQSNSRNVTAYLAAAALCMSIGPFTSYVMIPTNFALIKMNEEKGGARSAESSGQMRHSFKPGSRTELDSVNGTGEAAEFTDLSGPQERTPLDTTEEENGESRKLLGKFARLNAVRAVLLGAGGILGLVTAL
ncbi:uncharacterized protein BCR38DRAFT_298163, partial [Pseudomassariella vexata]